MGIFSRIKDKIFGKKSEPAAPPLPPPPTSSDIAAASTASHAEPALELVDVEAILSGMAAANSQKLNWRTSIVDLMKLVGMESSLAERRELATELGYSGDQKDTATMNIWLHKQVMRKLADNGGKVPADLLD